jgi:hypothetical protein
MIATAIGVDRSPSVGRFTSRPASRRARATSARQLALLAARVAGFDPRNALLDVSNVAGVLIHPLPILRSQGLPEAGHLVREQIEDAAVGGARG